MSFEVWEGEVRNRLKTEADINDSELQHGGPHMVEVLNSSQPGSERKGDDHRRTHQLSGYGPGTVFWTLQPRGFGRKDATSPMLKNRNRSVSVDVGKSDRLAV